MNYNIGDRVQINNNHWLCASYEGILVDFNIRKSRYLIQLDHKTETGIDEIWLGTVDFHKGEEK
jgi:hypothetical protein